MLRSKDPTGLAQEMWAILTLYQVLRTVMCEAAETRPGTDPDRMSFALALETARTHTTLADLGDGPPTGSGAIGRAVLAHPNPARRPRYSARKLKSPGNRYTYKDPTRPATSTRITTIDINIQAPTTHATPTTHQQNPDKPHREEPRHWPSSGKPPTSPDPYPRSPPPSASPDASTPTDSAPDSTTGPAKDS